MIANRGEDYQEPSKLNLTPANKRPPNPQPSIHFELDEDEMHEEKKDPVEFYNTFGRAMERLCIHCVNSKDTNEHEKTVAVHLLYSISRYLFINMNQASDSINFGDGEQAEELYQQAIRQLETMTELAHENDEEEEKSE